MRFPGEEDIKGAAEGFVRLQKTYRITTEDFAAGKIDGVAKVNPLTSYECYLIGSQLAQEGVHYDYAIEWLEFALRIRDEENENLHKIDEVTVLDWLQYSYYHAGNPLRALEMTRKIQNLDPDFPNLDSNLNLYYHLIAELNDEDFLAMKTQSELPATVNNDDQHFQELCRGEEILVNVSEIPTFLRSWWICLI